MFKVWFYILGCKLLKNLTTTSDFSFK
jgi:hypothetical protein